MNERSRNWVAIVLASMSTLGCVGTSRFALRAPLWRDDDASPFSPAPALNEEQDIANTVDVTLLRPISHWMLFEQAGEARDVNALDEVPDSSWFTNRAPTPADVARGPCSADEPAPPFTVSSTKVGGTTAGLVVQDAAGRRYVVKLDGLGPTQPEISTASDSIGSRLYWAAGFNVPCNRVIYAEPSDFVPGEHASERSSTGDRRALTSSRLAEILQRATHGADGTLRMSASLFIEGQPLGTWRAEGMRADDPNDRIPHEDRRELRGERFLAAWIGHWDSRGPQSYDAFVRTTETEGYVEHYFLDFSESLGGTPTRTRWPEPRVGYETVSDLPTVLEDVAGLGFVRRPWDEVEPDPRFPNLGFFDIDHFDPLAFSPQTPLVRWERAQAADLGWMARRLARFDDDHIRAAVRTGRLGDANEEARLVELLSLRRQSVLREAFARSSPLADLAVIEGRLCAFDLAIESSVSSVQDTHYQLDVRVGADERPGAVELERRGSLVCARLHPFAPDGVSDDAAERYAILELVRIEGSSRTVLRAHLYDLGIERGFVLVGIERP